MTWCSDCIDVQTIESKKRFSYPPSTSNNNVVIAQRHSESLCKTCPSCGYQIKCQNQSGFHDLPGLPAGVKFDPTDQELLEHLEGKVRCDSRKVHPLIDEFIPTLEGENGICYAHPEKLPGVSKDGLVRHFFHRPSKAYTTGTRKRRKVLTDAEGGETRWHKTGKTRAVYLGGKIKGYKKILVLYTNYGKQRKPEKTNWVMHQYHLGNNEEEKDGELVISKVFYQTQPRQCGSSTATASAMVKESRTIPKLKGVHDESSYHHHFKDGEILDHHNEYYNPPFVSFDQGGSNRSCSQLMPHFGVHDGSSFIP